MGMQPGIKRVFRLAFTLCLGLAILEPMSAANASLYQTNLQLQLEPGNSVSYPGTGNAWYDISGSSRVVTDTGTAATFTSGSPSYFTFNGTSSLFVGTNGGSGWGLGNDFTVAAWIKTTTTGGGSDHWTLAPIVTAETAGLANDWGFGINPSGKIAFGTGGSSDVTTPGSTSVNTGSWVFVAATRVKSSTQVKLYVNGIADDTATLSNGSNALTSQANLEIGSNTDTNPHFSGAMGGIYAYSSALSDAQVLQDYQATAGAYGYTAATSVTTALATAPVYRIGDTITATLSPSGSDGYVSFLANGKAIPGCKKVASSSGIATCLWKPSTHTASTISARLTPGVSYFTSSSGSVTAFVKARATTR